MAILLVVNMWIVDVGCRNPPTQPEFHLSDTTSHSILWKTDSLGYSSSRLLDVWGTSASNVYAVGLLTKPSPGLPVFIVHFDGSSWYEIKDDSLTRWIGAGLLAGIYGLSDSAIYVVGSTFDSYTSRGFAAIWNGKTWTNISPDSVSPLYSIWSRDRNDVYACGAHGSVLHYNGNVWKVLQTGTTLDVWQIIGLPTGDIYAVASNYFDSYAGSLVMRVEGDAIFPDIVFPMGQKFSIWGIGEEVYTTGEGSYLKLPGTPWKELLIPGPKVAMWTVHGSASNNVVLAGSYGIVIHWNGQSWWFYNELFDQSSFKSYFKGFASSNKYFLVGNTPTKALVSIGTRVGQ